MNILFVCTGNTCRSPMAEAICNKLAGKNIADSAGINTVTGLSASQNSIEVCKEIGIDLSGFTSTWICDRNPAEYDLFAVMSNSHKQVLVSLGIDAEKIIVLNISDPYGGDLETYRKCRDEIYSAVKNLLESLSL